MEYFWLGLGMSIVIGVTLGAIVLYSKLVETRAARHPKSVSAARQEEATRAAPTSSQPSPPTLAERATAHIMSRFLGAAGPVEPIATERRSDAVEQPTEHLGTEDGNDVPDLVEQLGTLDDDALLDILAGLRGEDGEYRFAESRVAKFIGGRVEDRLAQVRDVRGTEKPAPPGRLLRVRDEKGERVISL